MKKRMPRSAQRRPETRGLTRDASVSAGLALAMPSVAGITVTPQVALTFTAVFAAINVISRDFATLPPSVYQRKRGGGKSIAFDHAVQKRLNREPNPSIPRSNSLRFRQGLMGHVLGWGNGYWEIKRTGDGQLASLDVLHPGKTKPKETSSGRLYYELEDNRKLLPEDVFHLAGLSFDGVVGYNPIAMAREAIGLGKAAEQFGSSFYGNGAVPRGVLKTPKRLSETATKNLRASVNAVHQGSSQGNQLMILEDGLEWQGTSIAPDEAQFLLTRAFQVLEIARMFSLPPHKIGDYSQSHLANVEESNLDYLTTTLAGWLEAFEAEANLKLLSEDEVDRGLFIAHDMTRLLRGNMTARITYYKGMRELGCMNADDICLRENMNPIGKKKGGDKYLVQGNLTTLEAAGSAFEPDPATPPAAPNADPTADQPSPPGSLDEPGDGDEPSSPDAPTGESEADS